MSLELKPYREYKDSGLPWLGEVPAHWRLQRIKHAFKEASWRELHGDEVLLSLTRSRGLIPHSEASDKLPSAEDLNKYKVYKPGELVMNRMQAWSGMFGTAEIGGLVSPDYSVFEPTSGTEVNFFKTLFMTPLYTEQFAQRSQGIGSGFNRLYTLDFGAIPIATPPPEEQRMIARFLGSHDRLLNCLIRAKQRLIELLNEQKQAIIHRAVTRGLDPDAPTKLTDLDWLPEVPEHWDVAQLGRFITLQRGIDITKDVQTEGSIPVVSSGGIHSHHNKSTSTGPGVLVGRKGSVGSVYFVESDYWAHDTTLWVKKFGGNDPKFVYYVLKQLDLRRFDTGSANPTINRNVVHPEPVAFPPPTEQKAITLHLDKVNTDVEAAIQRARREIELIREYRARLISDVVTGKLDVRGVELPEPDKQESELKGLESVEPEAPSVTGEVPVPGPDPASGSLQGTR